MENAEKTITTPSQSTAEVITLTKENASAALEGIQEFTSDWGNSLEEGEHELKLVSIEVAPSKAGGKYVRAKLEENKISQFFVLVTPSVARILLDSVGSSVRMKKSIDQIDGYTSPKTGKKYNTYKYDFNAMLKA